MPRFSIFILLSIFIFSFFGSVFYGLDAYVLDSNAILVPPSLEHLLGTDRLGRDILARLIEGGKTSLLIGVGSAFIASIIGLLLGSMAGYFKGGVDKGFIILVDLFLTFPTFFSSFSISELRKCFFMGFNSYHLYHRLDDNG